VKFLKAITTDGETVYFNVSQILSMTPRKCGDITVLMGAGLYWHVNPNTFVFVDLEYLPAELMGV
jgi:hypothetical protein